MSLHYQEKELDALHQDVNAESQTISHNIQQQLTSYAEQLHITAQGWHSIAEINNRWIADINNIKRLNPYINEIKIYDFTEQKRLTIAEQNYVSFENKIETTQQAKYRSYLPTSLSRLEINRLFMSPPFALKNNETAVYLHIPIFIKQGLFAYLEVSFNLSKLLTHQVRTFQLDHPFSLSENGITIFSILPKIVPINQVNEQFSIPIFAHNWKLMVWSNHQHKLYQYIAYTGLSASILLALLAYLLLRNKQLKQQITRQQKQLQRVNKDVKANKSKLIQSNKLSSLGEIATGIAHEINQPLQVICIHADLCNDNLIKENYQLVEKSFHAILSQVDRIEKIVKQVGSFGRDSELNNYSNEQPADIFDSVINIIINQYKQENIELRQVLPSSLPAIFCNKIQIEQVLVNLLINAKDAVEHSEAKVVFIKAHDKQGKLYIEVSDTGSGIEEDKLDDIFTPFYTTKALGKGTGLGLSISYSIIHQHNGELKVSSEIGKGSTFTVVLPLSQRNREVWISQPG